MKKRVAATNELVPLMAQSQRLSLKDASTFFIKIDSEEQQGK
jgi:hypothetical protein